MVIGLTVEKTATSFAAPTQSKLRELAAIREFPRLAIHAKSLTELPRGSETVVVIPGFSTTDRATWPLRRMLQTLGHEVHGWGLGVNRAEVEAMLPTVVNMIDRRAQAASQPVSLIGWSNGGVFVREVARDRPDLVSQVLTYGTPIFGGPKFSRGAALYSPEEIDRIEAVVEQRNTIPIERPITAFYSKNDAIVDWRACIDDFSPDVENIEVHSTHAGMGIDPDIWRGVAERLGSSGTAP